MEKNIFIQKANEIHNNKYDYSLVNNTFACKDKLKIICPIHGMFEQRYDAHITGQGCGKCSKSILSNKEIFINEANIIHNNKYDYSLVNYINCKTKVKIICPIHEVFEITPDNHLSGHGCKKCSIDKISKTKIEISDLNFIDKANIVHNNKYDYSLINYVGSKTKIKIICPIHGIFEETPNDHLCGKGCCKCGQQNSKQENNIKKYLNDLNINYIENERNVLSGKEIDIYVPVHKLGIEFDGLFWHSDVYKDKNYHLNKTKECEEKNIQLLHIFEDEWLNKQEIVKSIIRSKLNIIENKIYARKCKIKEINSNTCIEFLNTNHIQGNINAKIKIGLYYNNELVSVMIFGKKRVAMGNKIIVDNEYEMLRFCNKLNTQVIGGASKLLNYFKKTYNPKSILTFADRRYSNGNLYKQLGFKFIGNTQPNYWYFKKNGITRYHRFGFRKNILITEGFDPNKTERQIMNERGYFRIYDCGHMKFEFIFSFSLSNY